MADTSVVLNLVCIGQAELLRDVHGTVIVPDAVAYEFNRLSQFDPRFGGRAFPSWIQVFADLLTARPELLRARLDAGETRPSDSASKNKPTRY